MELEFDNLDSDPGSPSPTMVLGKSTCPRANWESQLPCRPQSCGVMANINGMTGECRHVLVVFIASCSKIEKHLTTVSTP